MYEFQELSQEKKIEAIKKAYNDLLDCVVDRVVLVEENSSLAKKIQKALEISKNKDRTFAKKMLNTYAGDELRDLAMIAVSDATYDEEGRVIYEI